MKTYRNLLLIGCLVLGIFACFIYHAIAEIDFTSDPTIGSTSDSRSYQNVMTKYTDQEGNEEWSTDDREINVILEAGVKGLGFAECKFAPVRIANDNRSVWTDTDKVGTFDETDGTNPTCSTTPGTQVEVWRTVASPEAEGTYSWAAEGTIHAEPWYFKRTGGTNYYISFGGVGVTIKGTGSWEAMSSTHVIDRAAPSGRQGTWEVKHKYKCVTCDVKADTLAALSPGHDKVTCSREGCDVEYRECDTAAKSLHSLCEGCQQYKCNGKRHEQRTCNGICDFGAEGIFTNVHHCGKPYLSCDTHAADLHEITISCFFCYEKYKSCVYDGNEHAIQASCSETDENGFTCTVEWFHPCVYHTHQFGSGSQQGNGGGQQGNGGGVGMGQGTSNYLALGGQNGGGTPPSNGGCNTPPSNGGCNTPPPNGGCNTPPPNGGCTTTATACINPICIRNTACATYTCIRSIIIGRRADGTAITEPCGELFTQCQNLLMQRGICSGERKTTAYDYHSDEFY